MHSIIKSNIQEISFDLNDNLSVFTTKTTLS